ncbi:MAG: hypothetical protein EAZ74_04825, partial [Alphaproteobacteria bacterium]
MTTAVQHRRGTTAEHSTFTGLEGELTIDTTKDTAVIHDGTLAGGYPLAKENLANVTTSGLSSIDGASTASDDKFFIYDQSATALKTITRAELNNAMEQDALANVAITGGTINGTAIGGTTAAAGAFTTLTTSSTVTLNGGTANGVAYLNGSKVLTTGSALTFDGTRLTSTTGKFGSGAASNSASLMVNNVTNTATGIQLFQDGIESWIMGMPANSAGLAWSASGSEQMRLTSTGLGIGTSSPSNKLTVNSGASTTIAQFTSTGSNAFLGITNSGASAFIGADNTGAFLVQTPGSGYSTKLYLDSSGNLGIGTSSPATKLHVIGTIGVSTDNAARGQLSWDGTNGLYLNNTDNTPLRFGTSNTERMRLDSSGNLLVGRTSASAIFGTTMIVGPSGGSGTVSVPAGYLYSNTTNDLKYAAGTSASGAHIFSSAFSGSEYARIDSSGNLGLGVTPSAWWSSSKAIQV